MSSRCAVRHSLVASTSFVGDLPLPFAAQLALARSSLSQCCGGLTITAAVALPGGGEARLLHAGHRGAPADGTHFVGPPQGLAGVCAPDWAHLGVSPRVPSRPVRVCCCHRRPRLLLGTVLVCMPALASCVTDLRSHLVRVLPATLRLQLQRARNVPSARCVS